jgi:hypothetical protein
MGELQPLARGEVPADDPVYSYGLLGFEPQPDITAYELARIMQLPAGPGAYSGLFLGEMKNIDPDLRRHLVATPWPE